MRLFLTLAIVVVVSAAPGASQASGAAGPVSQNSMLVKFGTLCQKNPTNTPRPCDPKYGCGNYGARRDGGKRRHMGLDITCTDGDTVIAPFDVRITGTARPYMNKNSAINNGVRLSGQGLCFKLFYVKPVKTSGTLKKGERLGTMLSMQKVYPGIGSHVHVQMCDLSDPTKYF